MNIRPFTANDYTPFAAILNAVYREYPRTVEELRFWDEHRHPKLHFRRWLAECDGQVVAFAEHDQFLDMYHPQKFRLGLGVHPEYQGRGIGTALYNQVLDALQPLEPLSVRTMIREDHPRSIRFAQTRGFREELREWESRLDVTVFDETPYTGHEDRLRAQGIEIKTLAELVTDPERDRKLYDLVVEIERDVPAPEPYTPADFEIFVTRWLQNPNLLPEAFFIAVHDGEYIGTSALWNGRESGRIYTGLTGVKRSHRRRGVALGLKLRDIAYARDHGHTVIQTENESRNRPMLSINERLGFVKQPAWILFVKDW